ncbi:MAG: general secretion pathway protein GspK [Gammaproteobacteria bacterium]|nr:general secretion pathway protein GspK [Gammaproteobacteria bacterium]
MSRSPRGVALISILLVVVLMSTLTFQVYSHQNIVTAQTRVVFEANQMRHGILASEILAVELLSQDWEDESSRSRDDPFEPWAREQPVLEVAVGSLQYRVLDLNNRINLNAVANKANTTAAAAFARILQDIGGSGELLAMWQDWIDTDDVRSLIGGYQGREELDWLGHTPSFRTPNQLASDLSELRVFTPWDMDIYRELGQYVVVLPTTELKINVNTAPPKVLNALLPLAATQLSERASTRNFGSVEAFTELYVDFESVSQRLSVQSDFFEVRATLLGASSRMDLTSYLFRDPSTGSCHVFRRDFSTRHIWTS